MKQTANYPGWSNNRFKSKEWQWFTFLFAINIYNNQ